MSSLNTEIKHEENTMQGQSSDEIKNGNEPFETNTLDNTKSSEENITSEENKYENESCIVDKLTNITNAINEIVIENDEPVNNNVKNLTQEVDEMNITEKPKPKNGVVLLKETNSSLNCLLAYGSDDEDDDDDDEQSVSEEVFNSLSSFDSDGEMEEDDHTTESLGAIKKKPLNKPTKTVSEMMYEQLPQVVNPQDLNIPVDKKNFQYIGNVVSILDVLVTIEALPNIPAYDFDTIFFYGDDNDKKPIGQVFDILGQVKSPMYVICMNSIEDIKKMGITKGMKIYSIPESEFTHYVFVNELLKIKGSDASWINDVEVPPDMAEYSDDDTEYYSKTQQRLQTHTKRAHSSSLERYKRFERTMNKCNTLNTHVHQLIDKTHKIKAKKQRQHQQQQQQSQVQQFNHLLFDPRVPPPYVTQQYLQGFPLNNQQNWYNPTTGHTGPYFTQNLQYFGNYVDENCPGPSSSSSNN